MFIILIGIVTLVAATVAVMRIAWKDTNDLELLLAAFVGCAVIGGLVWTVVTLFLLNFTTGLYPGYSEGERSGYVNKMSVKGLVWKTNEGELQLGAGEAASLQPPFEFSVVDPNVLAKIIAAQESGARVSITYREWLIMPFRLGDSGYEVTDIRETKR